MNPSILYCTDAITNNQRISQRAILSIATMTAETTGLYLRDISQAYIQSTTLLNRDFYVNPPRELAKLLNLKDNSVLKIVKPLFSVSEAENHWLRPNTPIMSTNCLWNSRPTTPASSTVIDHLVLSDFRLTTRSSSETTVLLKRSK
jgi:hypothetical protein